MRFMAYYDFARDGMVNGDNLIQQGFLTGELLDEKYRIDKLLGHGGMGAVYRAMHLGTRRIVALKVIHPQFSQNEEFVERFRREAEAAGRLRHPNVVDVTDFGFAQTGWGRIAYLVMEYLDGCTLADVLAEEERLPPDWVVDILEQVCSAVDEAHRIGIIHRDLKPENIWLEPNRRGGYTIKVLDFGLVKLGGSSISDIEHAKSTAELSFTSSAQLPDRYGDEAISAKPAASFDEAESPTLMQSEETDTIIQSPESPAPARANVASDDKAKNRATKQPVTSARENFETAGAIELTRVGSLMGTPLYMSPEQCRGEQLDARSDIYSLGVIAYRMLTGETPFTGSIDDLIKLHGTAEPPPIRKKSPKVPKRMARPVMATLAKNPAQRPETAAGFASALRAGAEGSSTLLRQAVSLYSDRFPAFIKLSLLAYAPLIAAVGFINLSDKVIPWETLPPTSQMLAAFLIIFSLITTNLLAYSIVAALTVPLVVQAMIAPLRRVQIRTTFATLKRRWWVFSAATIIVMAIILTGTVVLILPGVMAAVCYCLYAPVAVMESSGVRGTLKRARGLVKRSWSTALIITVLQFALPVLVWVASIDTSLTLKLADDYSPKEFSFYFSISGRSTLYQLLNIFVTPLTAIMTALLYLKARQAGGESFRDSIEQFDAIEIPRRKWQALMRSRAVSPPSTMRGHESQK